MAWTNEQEKAISTTDQNVIVSAGAGSGKTAVLKEHIIRMIKEGTHVNNFLVLTFTNKAANELKKRIRDEILKNNELKEELDLVDIASISTFDAFTLSLVKKYNYLLNVSSNVKVVDSALISAKKIKTIDEIFDELYESNNKKFINLITTFCIKKKDDKIIKNAILKISEKLDLKIDKKIYLDNYINEYYNEEKINKYLDDYNKLIMNKLNKISELTDELSKELDADYMEKFTSALDSLMNAKSYEEVRINLNVDIPRIPSGTSEYAKKIKKEINDNIIKKDLADLTHLSINELKESYFSTKDNVEIIVDIIKELDNRINKYKFENDTYEYNDIAKMAINLVKDNIEIQEELKNSFREIIIDEYQDTSDIQEELINLISNNNVYCVGDIKQSIYRFRNANPYIFKKKYDLYSENIVGTKLDLTGNFRSREEVIKNINEIFNIIMTDEVGGADYLKEHNMTSGNKDYPKYKVDQEYGLKVLEYNEDKEYDNLEIEAFIIAKDIEDKINNRYQIYDKNENRLRDVTYNDFTILMDRKDSFDTYSKIFTYKNIPLVPTRDGKMNDEIEIYLIKNIIKLISKLKNNNKDTEFKHAFISIARSFLYKIDDNTIYQTIANNTYDEIDFINKAKEISNNLDNISLSNLIKLILKEFNYYENVVTINNIDNSLIRINKIKDYASELEKLGLTALDFTNYIDELLEYEIDLKYDIEDNSDGVKIMTIHASKGLQYPICYYSGLYKEISKKAIQSRFLYDETYGIIIPYFKEGIGDVFTRSIMTDKYLNEEISEKIRLFYVALTRAEEDMIIVKPYSDKIVTKYNSLLDIVNKAKVVLNNYCKEIELDNINVDKNYKYNKIKDINTLIPTNTKKINEININIDKEMLISNKYSKNGNNIIDKKAKKELEYGTYIHEQFELDNFNNPKNELTIKFLKHFNIEKANIIKEYEFIDDDKHGIIDLMIEYEDHVDIIDYKTKNINDEEYKNQLNGYKEYIKKVTNKKINTYLYSILEDKLKEV